MGRLERMPEGSWGVVIKAKKAPRLQAIGLVPGAEVRCKYKSRGIMVLEIGNYLVAAQKKSIWGVWVDY